MVEANRQAVIVKAPRAHLAVDMAASNPEVAVTAKEDPVVDQVS